MNAQRWTVTLLSIVATCCIHVPSAFSQNLADAAVEKAARPLVEKRVVDGLSVGYIAGKHQGTVHLGSPNRAGKRPDDTTLYEIGSVTKVFTSLMLADAVVRSEIDLNAAADVPNAAGIRLPSRDGRSIRWIDLCTHRSGLPRNPDNLQATDLINPWRDYDSKKLGVPEPIQIAAPARRSAAVLEPRHGPTRISPRAEGRQVVSTIAAGANRRATRNDRLCR